MKTGFVILAYEGEKTYGFRLTREKENGRMEGEMIELRVLEPVALTTYELEDDANKVAAELKEQAQELTFEVKAWKWLQQYAAN